MKDCRCWGGKLSSILGDLHGGNTRKMGFKIENGKLVVDLDLKSTLLSKSGKTYMIAGSGGFSWVSDGEGGEIGVSYNVVRRKK